MITAADLYRNIMDRTWFNNYLARKRKEREDQVPPVDKTRPMGPVDRGVQLLRDIVAGIEDPCSNTEGDIRPPTQSSPPLFFAPRPLRPDEQRAPLLDLQWELEDTKPLLPVFHSQPIPYRVVAPKQDKITSSVRKPQPPIGTGRPRPRATATDDTSSQELFRLRPLPPCPQPPIGPTRDLPPLPYHGIGKRVFFLPPKKEDASSQSRGDCLLIQDDQVLLPLNQDDTDPRFSTIPNVQGWRTY
ncbi:hypothetical protein QCA50_014963 [Cerrena zonata]|uniref:Uncharacterized protein n=1 Tax=Cerrena zonata TaxID=2478898 RepID=A0AAW0FUQ3_9APHY